MKKEPLLIAFASPKGEVEKSAFTVLVASILHYQKGLKVGVVDCESPQHSISRMRDRNIESVQESNFLKVTLYRQHELRRERQIDKHRAGEALPIIKIIKTWNTFLLSCLPMPLT